MNHMRPLIIIVTIPGHLRRAHEGEFGDRIRLANPPSHILTTVTLRQLSNCLVKGHTSIRLMTPVETGHNSEVIPPAGLQYLLPIPISNLSESNSEHDGQARCADQFHQPLQFADNHGTSDRCSTRPLSSPGVDTCRALSCL